MAINQFIKILSVSRQQGTEKFLAKIASWRCDRVEDKSVLHIELPLARDLSGKLLVAINGKSTLMNNTQETRQQHKSWLWPSQNWSSFWLVIPFRAQMTSSNQQCMSLLGGYNTTILMVADPGSFSGTAEAKYYIANLEASSVSPQQKLYQHCGVDYTCLDNWCTPIGISCQNSLNIRSRSCRLVDLMKESCSVPTDDT